MTVSEIPAAQYEAAYEDCRRRGEDPWAGYWFPYRFKGDSEEALCYIPKSEFCGVGISITIMKDEIRDGYVKGKREGEGRRARLASGEFWTEADGQDALIAAIEAL